MVALAATDPDGAQDVASTSYASNGGEPQTYAAPFAVSGDGNQRVQFWSTDQAGNEETPHPSVNFGIDSTPPAISIVAPGPITYLLNQAATANFSIEDALSGVDWSSVVSTQPNGSTLATATAGAFTFTVSAADLAGNAASRSVSYTVGYVVCALYDQSKAHKSGSTIPIKVRLIDANGANVSGASPIVRAVRIERVSDSAPGILEDSGNANPDYCFRYSEDLGGYIYNLSLKGYQTGTYRMHFTAGSDPTDHTVEFQVK